MVPEAQRPSFLNAEILQCVVSSSISCLYREVERKKHLTVVISFGFSRLLGAAILHAGFQKASFRSSS